MAAAPRVRARMLRVGDVATVTGSEELAAAIRAREIGPAPPPGFTQTLALESLAERLREGGVDSKHVRVEGPAEASVTAEAKTIPGRDLVEAARVQILHDTEAFAGESEIVPEARSAPADVVVSPGRVGTRISIRSRAGARTGRNVWLDATVTVDGEPAAVVALQFDVRVFREVATTTRTVSRGEILGVESLVLVRADVSGAAGAPVESLDDALGLAASRAIPAGAVVRVSDLFRPPVVRRGDVVTLRVRYGQMTITARGVARSEGATGDVVSVANSDTNRVVSGRVTEAGLVDVLISRPAGDAEEKP
jgi:flagella basal body P-ring formation protein FlgA